MFASTGAGIPDVPTKSEVAVPAKLYDPCFQMLHVTAPGVLSIQLAGDSAPTLIGDVVAGQTFGPFAGRAVGADTTARCVVLL